MQPRLRLAHAPSFLVLGLLIALGACKPNYPRCESDDNCQERGEVCVAGQCQECRGDDHCLQKYPGERRVCNGGRCEVPPECRVDPDCAALGPGLICRASKCVPDCLQDADCGGGRRCVAKRCVASCEADVECGPQRACRDGLCEDVVGPLATNIAAGCRPLDPRAGEVVALPPVAFAFDQYELGSEARQALLAAVDCLKQAPHNLQLVVEGHCDDRGTQEYNLALGEKRAHAVQLYLKTLGFDARRMTVRSKGQNEPLCTQNEEACWSRNRRVQFIQSLVGR